MTDIRLRDLEAGDAGWVLLVFGIHHREVDGFDASFEALVANVLAEFISHRDPELERAWIAFTTDGTRLGSIFCVRLDETTAKLRLFYVAERARGSGLAQQLIEACIAHARACGFERLTLWTHKSHQAAGRVYARNGFECVEEKPVRSFGQDLIEQTWTLDLRS